MTAPRPHSLGRRDHHAILIVLVVVMVMMVMMVMMAPMPPIPVTVVMMMMVVIVGISVLRGLELRAFVGIRSLQLGPKDVRCIRNGVEQLCIGLRRLERADVAGGRDCGRRARAPSEQSQRRNASEETQHRFVHDLFPSAADVTRPARSLFQVRLSPRAGTSSAEE